MSHNAGVTDPKSGAMMVLYITSDISTSGSVEIAGKLLQNFTVTANQVTFIDIPTSAYLQYAGLSSNGIHITSAYPIAVYAHIYAFNVSGATLLLPVNAMGKEYMSLNYTQKSNASADNPAYSTFAIIGTEDNTTVSITPTGTLLDGHSSNVNFTITLNKGQVYQGLSETDLTGTQIQSISNTAGGCKKIAVFSGSTRMGIGCNDNGRNFSSDNLFQQVYPTSTWGKNYVAVPLRSRPYDVYRIVLSDPNTIVKLNGSVVPTSSFINNLYYEFKSQQESIITADKAIQVVQYSPSQNQHEDCGVGTGDVGDPEMIYLSPVEQGLSHVTLYATGYYRIQQSYINVVIPTSAVSSFKVDGSSYASSFIPIVNSSYSYAQISVSSGPQTGSATGAVSAGTHTLDASVPFNAIVYGFGSTESYGYAAGTNLADFSENLTVANANDPTAAQITAGCSNLTYKAKITLAFQTTDIKWKIDGALVKEDTAPVPAVSVKDSKTLYTYEYNANLNFIAGNHTVVATVFNPVADVCGSTQDIQSVFSISDPPPVTIDAPVSDCFGNLTPFKDSTVPVMGQSIKSWFWDFGDNTTSTEQSPTHKYAAVGNYQVRLTEVDNNGCTNISAPKAVHIAANPIAKFSTTGFNCVAQTVTFTDGSATSEGTITKWLWDFGDGTLLNATNGQPQQHKYAAVGNYTVKLTTATASGCSSDVFTQNLVINPSPVAGFTVPDLCVGEPANFTNTSTISDGTDSELTYLWDFGETGASPATGQSTLKNPQHFFRTVGPHTITLTTTSKYGCADVSQKTITINGSNPVADFDPESNCSGDMIVFDDKSSVDAYYVTKIIWWFDYDNHPDQSETFEDGALHANKKYTHTYGLFNSPASKSYRVRMEVYSGQTCFNIKEKIITVNANPVISLSANNKIINTTDIKPDTVSLCYEDSPLQIVEDKGIYIGLGTFSGNGISATGLINPQKAGPGIYIINYLFTTSGTGCTYAASFILKINPMPSISLPEKFTVLEDNQVTLRAVASVASGGKLTYKWTPSAGLSADDVAAPVATLHEDATYTLTVTSDKGCSTTVKTFVKVLKVLVIPNTFTPNSDGINDRWEIKYLNDYPNATVEIFNRYGTRIFYSNGYGVPWDGRSNGADMPVGTYYYIISPNSGRKPSSGYLTIIR